MTQPFVNPVKRVARRYYVEFVISMVAYVIVVGISRNLLEGRLSHASMTVQISIALLPLIPVLFMFAAVVRFLLHSDELCRRIHVDSLAIAGGVTMLLSITYGLIEGGPLPHLSAWWTYSVFMVAWLVASCFVRRRYR